MASFNSCTFMGNLGQDPELRYTPNGKAVCNFSLAINEGGKDKKTLWMRVTCWDKNAENAAKYLKKGKPALVAGYLEEQTWKDRDGAEQKRMQLQALRVVFVGSAPDAHEGPQGQWNRDGGDRRPPDGKRHPPPPNGVDDDIPF